MKIALEIDNSSESTTFEWKISKFSSFKCKSDQLECFDGLSLKRRFGGCGHGFSGCDGLGELGGFNGLGGFGGFDGLSGFDRLIGFDEFSGFDGFSGFSEFVF